MRELRVWAPIAERLDLRLESRGLLVPMQREDAGPQDAGRKDAGREDGARGGWRGWWRSELEVEPGEDYRLSIDGGAPLPDPRSGWQPDGVHGPSRVVDHEAHRWSDVAWRGPHLPSEVVYEAHVGTFSPEGTFYGAVRRLDHLASLGAGIVELMPVAEFPGGWGWGYDGVDLYAPHHGYGGPAGLRRLADEAHARGLGVFLDVVYNHLGPDGNYLSHFGPYFTDRYSTPWGRALNLDGPGSDGVRSFLVGNALHWLERYHVDGLRLDAVHAIVDTSAVHLLEQLSAAVADLAARLGRRLWLVAESDLNDPRLVRPVEAGGYGLDAQWSDDFHHALWAALTGEGQGYYGDFGTLSDVARALETGWVYDGRYSTYRGRRHGRPATGVPGSRLLGYLQNHDQVGNRALGERAAHLMTPDRLAVAAGIVCCSPFVPMIFQGEEWGARTPFRYFCDHQDPELAAAVSGGRRREFAAFGWDPDRVPDPQDPATFATSRLDWTEAARDDHRRLLGWWRTLLAVRRRCGWLSDGRMDRVRALADDPAGVLLVTRGPGMAAANLGRAEVAVAAPPGALVLAASRAGVVLRGGEALLPPDSFALLGPQPE
ncbi:MAG: malto-oligosyltrehalose trehalohydrolase [Acidimicrobiales bacterium]